MRQKRAKSYRKQLLVYHYTFGFREPYQVIVDDQIVTTANESSFDLVKGLQRTLQAEVKVMITQCCMQVLYELGNQDAISMAKEFERRRCNHNPKDPKTPIECIESIANISGNNKHRYIVASQDIDIRRKLRRVPGIPLVHISRAVMVMEPLSDASAKISKRKEQAKLYEGLNNAKQAGLKVDEVTDKSTGEQTNKKRKRGPKGPNPLSMKKGKKDNKPSTLEPKSNVGEENTDQEASEKKRRRRRHGKKVESGELPVKNTEIAIANEKDTDI